jgi:sugar O-acyltransferase (sialic acid O-acetyltransferase NeuD family)
MLNMMVKNNPAYNSAKPLVIVGDGETAQIAYEYFTCDSPLSVVSFAVEREYKSCCSLNGLPIIPLDELTDIYPPAAFQLFIAISSIKMNRVRTRLYSMLKSIGYEFATYVSSRSFVWRNVEYGENCFIFENNTIQPFVRIGNNVVLWSGNHIGHNTTIRDNVFVTSQVVVSGFCDIGENSFLGVNSTIINNITVGKDCFIGAGALIQKDANDGFVYQSVGTEPSKVGSLRLFKVKE